MPYGVRQMQQLVDLYEERFQNIGKSKPVPDPAIYEESNRGRFHITYTVTSLLEAKSVFLTEQEIKDLVVEKNWKFAHEGYSFITIDLYGVATAIKETFDDPKVKEVNLYTLIGVEPARWCDNYGIASHIDGDLRKYISSLRAKRTDAGTIWMRPLAPRKVTASSQKTKVKAVTRASKKSMLHHFMEDFPRIAGVNGIKVNLKTNRDYENAELLVKVLVKDAVYKVAAQKLLDQNSLLEYWINPTYNDNNFTDEVTAAITTELRTWWIELCSLHANVVE